MKLICVALVICLLFTVSLASDKCIHNGHEFGPGELYRPIGECAEYECHNDELGLHVTGSSCGDHASANVKCYFTEIDTTKPYPACCPKLVCPDEQ